LVALPLRDQALLGEPGGQVGERGAGGGDVALAGEERWARSSTGS